MSPATSAAILSVLNLPNFKDGNRENLDIEGKNGVISKICGIKVKVTGTALINTQTGTQGTTVTPTITSEQVFEDGQIMVVSDDYLKFAKIYENTYNSEVLGNAMVTLCRLQVAYIPIWKP